MFTTYTTAANYLQDRLPFFQKSGAAAYHPGLDTTKRLLAYLGDPHVGMKFVHVGGTNGKGSCSHMLASVLQSAGFKTGLYTSPHLKRITERCRVDGTEMDELSFVELVNRIAPAIGLYSPTFFEVTTAMAMAYFSKSHVDIAVIEVGLGGRLDATNVISPEACLITNIGHDHLDILGPTLRQVAREKAGIIKAGIPVVIGEHQQEIDDEFRQSALTIGSSLKFAQDVCSVKRIGENYELKLYKKVLNVKPDLVGYYQEKNIRSVIALILVLREKGWIIDDEAIADGISMAARRTGLRGRWQKIGENPLVICDTAHNPEGIREVISQAMDLRPRQLHWVFGMVGDKDAEPVLELLPRTANYYFCRANSARSMDPLLLRTAAARHGIVGDVFESVGKALQAAREKAGTEDLILVGGSTYVVAELDLN